MSPPSAVPSVNAQGHTPHHYTRRYLHMYNKTSEKSGFKCGTLSGCVCIYFITTCTKKQIQPPSSLLLPHPPHRLFLHFYGTWPPRKRMALAPHHCCPFRLKIWFGSFFYFCGIRSRHPTCPICGTNHSRNVPPSNH